MKSGHFQRYLAGKEKISETQKTWPLYGAGLENLGIDGTPVVREVPAFSDDELLMRIDAVSLCYTDVKEIDNGQTHPRLTGRNLKEDPVIPGHEISFIVVGVGKNLANDYKIGDRYTLQPDVWVDGKSIPFSFGMDGGYRQYAKIGSEILNGDAGNYLIPIPDGMTAAAAAITEPWACVEASYRMQYRSALSPDGNALFWGGADMRQGYHLDEDWVVGSKPAAIYACGIHENFKEAVQILCEANDIRFAEISREEIDSQDLLFNDILVFEGTAQDVAFLEEHKTKVAVIAFLCDKDGSQIIDIDLGRLHYDDMLYVGTSSLEISKAYTETIVRTEFKKDGIAWILGAGGPMGRMHLQRAIEAKNGPGTIITSNVTEARFNALRDFFLPLAQKHNKEIFITNPVKKEAEYQAVMEDIMRRGGVDDIELMAASSKVVEDSCQYLASNGVINLFAGMKRGTKMPVNSWMISGEKQIRFIGHSGSGLDDQKAVVNHYITGDLNPNLSVSAIGGLNQIPDGIRAMKNSVFAGKIVIFPQIEDFPLTSLQDMKSVLPEVAEKLGENDTWNIEAEQAFLESQLT
jgi:L-sorbose 1-phosphate reductase